MRSEGKGRYSKTVDDVDTILKARVTNDKTDDKEDNEQPEFIDMYDLVSEESVEQRRK